MSSEPHNKAPFCGELSRSGLKISSVWSEIFTRSIGIEFFQSQGPLGSQRFLRFLRLRCPSRTPEIAQLPRQEKAMLHCDLRLRWKLASDLRFQAAISEPETPSFCGISGALAQSTRKSLAIAIVRFWCAKDFAVKFAPDMSILVLFLKQFHKERAISNVP